MCIRDRVEREGRALVYVASKWDLEDEPQSRLAKLKTLAEDKLPQLKGSPFVALSSHSGRGVERLMPAVLQAYDTWSVKVKTKDLNTWLSMATQRHPPPAVDGKRIKPKYIAQTKARPPTFVLFASRAAQLPDSYRRYLINSIRESFDLPGVAVRLIIDDGTGYLFEVFGPDRRTAVGGAYIRNPRDRACWVATDGGPSPVCAR